MPKSGRSGRPSSRRTTRRPSATQEMVETVTARPGHHRGVGAHLRRRGISEAIIAAGDLQRGDGGLGGSGHGDEVSRRNLQRMDDHMLADIGVSHAQAKFEADRKPWHRL